MMFEIGTKITPRIEIFQKNPGFNRFISLGKVYEIFLYQYGFFAILDDMKTIHLFDEENLWEEAKKNYISLSEMDC